MNINFLPVSCLNMYSKNNKVVFFQNSCVQQNKEEQNNYVQNFQYPYLSFKSFSPFDPSYRVKYKSIEEYLNCNLNYQDKTEHSFNDYVHIVKKNKNLQSFASELYSITRSTTYFKGGITYGEFVDILKKQKIRNIDETIDYIDKEHHFNNVSDVYRSALELRHEFFNHLIDKLSEVNPDSDFLKDGEEVMINIATSFYEKYNNDFSKYNESIKSKLGYSDKSSIQKLNLQDEIKKLPSERQEQIKEQFFGDYPKMMKRYIAEGCVKSRAPIEYSKGVDTALIQMLPRYVQERKDEFWEIMPLSRRLEITNMSEFLKQFKIGDSYSYPYAQSCSKSLAPAESWFRDDNISLNVIFRIHPKAKETKAFDIKDIDANKETNYVYYDDMEPMYFNSEVLYPPSAKFKVLGIKKLVENHFDSRNDMRPDYFKTIIDLQEV